MHISLFIFPYTLIQAHKLNEEKKAKHTETTAKTTTEICVEFQEISIFSARKRTMRYLFMAHRRTHTQTKRQIFSIFEYCLFLIVVIAYHFPHILSWVYFLSSIINTATWDSILSPSLSHSCIHFLAVQVKCVVICCRIDTNSWHLWSNNRSNVRIVRSNTYLFVFWTDGALVAMPMSFPRVPNARPKKSYTHFGMDRKWDTFVSDPKNFEREKC